jgi:hypothetical protein
MEYHDGKLAIRRTPVELKNCLQEDSCKASTGGINPEYNM